MGARGGLRIGGSRPEHLATAATGREAPLVAFNIELRLACEIR